MLISLRGKKKSVEEDKPFPTFPFQVKGKYTFLFLKAFMKGRIITTSCTSKPHIQSWSFEKKTIKPSSLLALTFPLFEYFC